MESARLRKVQTSELQRCYSKAGGLRCVHSPSGLRGYREGPMISGLFQPNDCVISASGDTICLSLDTHVEGEGTGGARRAPASWYKNVCGGLDLCWVKLMLLTGLKRFAYGAAAL